MRHENFRAPSANPGRLLDRVTEGVLAVAGEPGRFRSGWPRALWLRQPTAGADYARSRFAYALS
jgi:hypothetical protein